MNILTGISCDVEGIIGVERDVIILRHSDFDKLETFKASNIDTNGDLINVITRGANSGLIIEGTETSVRPSVSSNLEDDSVLTYSLSLELTILNKKSKYRNVLMSMSNVELLVVLKDKSSGKFELFGVDCGMSVQSLSREVGIENRFHITLSTPQYRGMSESILPPLAKGSIINYNPITCVDNSIFTEPVFTVNKLLINTSDSIQYYELGVDFGDENFMRFTGYIQPNSEATIIEDHVYDSGMYTLQFSGVCTGSTVVEVGALLDSLGENILTSLGETIYT